MNHTYQICISDVLHVISTQESLPGCSSHAKHAYLKNVWQPPALPCRLQHSTIGRTDLHRRVRDGNGCFPFTHRHQTFFLLLLPYLVTTRQKCIPYCFFRKEVIQPHLPIQLPCYDFTPVISPAFDGSFFTVRPPASGIADSHGVTGGVYKTRERIHRGILIRDY